MVTDKTNEKEKKENGVDIFSRWDFYIVFLFLVQIYIYFTKASAFNLLMFSMLRSNRPLTTIAFFFYCISFSILFYNLFLLWQAFKADTKDEKKNRIGSTILWTVIFFVVSFLIELLILKIRLSAV